MSQTAKLANRYLRWKVKYGHFLPLILGGISLYCIFWFGILIYWHIEGWTFWDSVYQVIITLSTVGFQEVHPLTANGRIFTSLLIFWG